MPSEVERALEQEGFLFIRERSTGTRYKIRTRVDGRSLRAPFHLTCTLPVR